MLELSQRFRFLTRFFGGPLENRRRPCSPLHRGLLRLSVSILLACVCGIVLGGIVATRSSHNPSTETEGCINAAIGSSFAGPIAGLITLPAATPLFFALLTLRDRRRARQLQRMATAALSQPDGTECIAALAAPPRFRSGFQARRLRRRSPLRIWLTHYQASPSAASGAALLSALTDTQVCSWEECAAGYRALSEIDLSPAEHTRATQILSHALSPPPASHTVGRTVAVTSLFGLLTTVLVPFLPSPLNPVGLLNHFTGIQWFLILLTTNSYFPHNSLLALLLLVGLFTVVFSLLAVPFVFAGVLSQDRRRSSMVQKAAVTTLKHVGDPGAIASLYEHVRHQTHIGKEALVALRAIVPTVTTAWYGRLPSDAGSALTHLAGSSEEALALMALDALDKAGDGNCVTAVERLTRNAGSRGVRERASAVLPVLIARRKRESSSASLLRPGQAGTSQHLVRPIYGADPDVTDLLRPSDPERPAEKSAE